MSQERLVTVGLVGKHWSGVSRLTVEINCRIDRDWREDSWQNSQWNRGGKILGYNRDFLTQMDEPMPDLSSEVLLA